MKNIGINIMTEVNISRIKVNENNLIIKDAQARENINSLSTNFFSSEALNSTTFFQIGQTLNKLSSSTQDLSYGLNSLSTNTNNNLNSLSTNINNNLNSLSTNISNSYLPLTGGTLNGSLTTSLQLVIKDDTIDTSTSPESDVWPRHLIIKDKDDEDRGHVEVYNKSTGIQGIQLETKRVINDNNIYNGLQLGIDPEGNRSIKISESKIWRTALGASADGIWPISLGGTGNNSNFTNGTFSANGTNFSEGTITVKKWGRVVQVETSSLKLKKDLKTTAIEIGTINYKPATKQYLMGDSTTYVINVMIDTDGKITMRMTGSSTLSSGTTIAFCHTFLV